jgi:hypothetical protein
LHLIQPLEKSVISDNNGKTWEKALLRSVKGFDPGEKKRVFRKNQQKEEEILKKQQTKQDKVQQKEAKKIAKVLEPVLKNLNDESKAILIECGFTTEQDFMNMVKRNVDFDDIEIKTRDGKCMVAAQINQLNLNLVNCCKTLDHWVFNDSDY